MDVSGKRVSVIGLGRSGVAAAKLLSERGAAVVGSDLKGRGDLCLNDLDGRGVKLQLGENPSSLLNADLIVASPGVPPWAPILRDAEKRGVEVVGELELASWFLRGELVGVTGTNGKTTTVALLGEMVKGSGRKVLVGGNIYPGSPLSDLVGGSTDEHTIVCEVSTFQLERTKTFRPKIGVFLNVSPDHLDRHGNFEKYLALKTRLFSNQEDDDFAVLNRDDPLVLEATSRISSKKVFFSRKEKLKEGVWLKDGEIFSSISGAICKRGDVWIGGEHILEDVLASVAVSSILGIDGAVAREAIRAFRGVVHRMEEVGALRGVRFVNNSMCTNPASFTSSLQALDEPIVLICGGKEKGGEVEGVVKGIEARAKAAILIGESGEKLEQALRKRGYHAVGRAESMEEAVRDAFTRATPGDVVLLSPGFASFDWFRDFAHRGEEFKSAVGRLNDEV